MIVNISRLSKSRLVNPLLVAAESISVQKMGRKSSALNGYSAFSVTTYTSSLANRKGTMDYLKPIRSNLLEDIDIVATGFKYHKSIMAFPLLLATLRGQQIAVADSISLCCLALLTMLFMFLCCPRSSMTARSIFAPGEQTDSFLLYEDVMIHFEAVLVVGPIVIKCFGSVHALVLHPLPSQVPYLLHTTFQYVSHASYVRSCALRHN